MRLFVVFAVVLAACSTPPVVPTCAENRGGCSVHASCDDASGSIRCTCGSGYAGDGVTCTQVDLCAKDNGGCDAHATCTSREGTRSCACGDGYTGDGFHCAPTANPPRNPCETNNGDCDAHATCTFDGTVRHCACASGYTGDGFHCAANPPANPCDANNGGCDAHATCSFDGAARHCGCGTGYTGDGLTCTPAATCAPVTARADVDAWSMRAPGLGFGRIFDQASGSHSDVFLENPSGRLRLGIRRDWGGTVVFWGLSADPASNTVDANDTGRELQLAIYDPTRAAQGCAWNASCQQAPSTCAGGITYLGWNPVQGGDECNHGAQVLSAGRVGDALSVVVKPVQWNPDWDRADCAQSACPPAGRPVDVTYRLDFRFIREHVVEVAMEVSSQEPFSHPLTEQEFPTLYVAHGGHAMPDLPLLLDAAGNGISLTTPANDGFYVGNFVSPRPWTTWQRPDRAYGVGLGQDSGITHFQGWRGDGSSAPYFHNVRAQTRFGLGAGGLVRGLAYLALGSFGTVQSEMEAALAARPPFGVVDEPPRDRVREYPAGQAVSVSGWVLDTAHVASVDLLVDGHLVTGAPVGGARPDVCAVYPEYDGCPQVGFSASVPTAGLDGCDHLLRVVARDANGNESVLGERVLRPR